MPRPNNVGVGTAIIIFNEEDKVLLLRRKGAHAAGCWSVPGGWIDYEDSDIEEAARREVKEETGLIVADFHECGFTTELHPEIETRTITLYFSTIHNKGIPHIMESEKCDSIGWYSPSQLPSPLWPGLKACILKARFAELDY